MGFRESAYCKVWETEAKNDRWTKMRITVSHKNKETDEYEQDFSGWVDCFGTAVATKAARLKDGARIRLKSVDVTNTYDKEKRVMYWNPKVYDFELADDAGSGSGERSTAAAKPKKQEPVDEGYLEDDSDLPF